MQNQLSVPEALYHRHIFSTQLLMNSLRALQQGNPRFQEHVVVSRFIPNSPAKDAGDTQLWKFLLFKERQQVLQNASALKWAQSVHRNLVSDGSDRIHTTSGSILNTSTHLDSSISWDSKSSDSSVSSRLI
jgi:hypothetical protein